MDIVGELKKLSMADAPTGFETPVTKLCRSLLEPYCDEIIVDPVGSLIAKRRGYTDDKKTVMLISHIDEIGFIITGAEKDKNDEPTGFLRFSTLGGVDARILPASTLKILTEEPVYGVIDVLPPHILKAEDTEKVQSVEDMRIDVGGAEAAAAIPIGTPAVFAAAPIARDGKLFSGKAMDDRSCFLALVLALHELGDVELDVNVVIAASSQEEVGTRGAYSATYSVHPEYAIVADVGFAEQPDLDKPEIAAKLGKGACVNFCANADRVLTKRIIEHAERNEIPIQVFAEGGGDSGTDARAVQISREGVATAILSLPVRYMHTPNETLDITDIESLAALIASSLKGGVFHA